MDYQAGVDFFFCHSIHDFVKRHFDKGRRQKAEGRIEKL
jgi:hypothetical protein